jgi:hypothetical protein
MTDAKAAAEEPCPFCDRLDEHQHEFFDVLSPECEHEMARLRTENARLLAEIEQGRIDAAAARATPDPCPTTRS